MPSVAQRSSQGGNRDLCTCLLFLLLNNIAKNNDLVKRCKNLTGKKSLRKIKSRIENDLHDLMRKQFYGFLSIGGVLGYDKLQEEMKKAIELLRQLNNR